MSHIVVITTTASADEAAALGRGLVEARLAACVQVIGPIRSFYHWDGAVQDDQEWQCHVKSTADRLDQITEYIQREHSYDEPEVIALPVVGGSAGYLDWVIERTR
ncbi:divalent-cation tolerance protein CutA [Actinokineospora sp. HUAS TT18]|uniref:divalent-cation tolerance protein CutA n=1 Tax=Actinokineospora sp. HUAS TT18 TaxID=3447451 RepID=UPI003F528BCF